MSETPNAADLPLPEAEAAAAVEAPRDKRYWRSLDRLLDSPAVREELARELPAGALDPPDEVTRRGVLQLLAASFGMAGLAACRRPLEHIVPYVQAPENLVPGVPQRYATVLPLGTEALGVVVETHEGRPTKVEGNPAHPASHGAASALAQAAVLDLYDPDRAATLREGGEERDWAAFEAWWTERAAALAGDGGAKLAVLASPFASPTLARLARALLARYPAATWVAWGPVSDEATFTGNGDMRPVYHLDRARTVLAVDCDLLLTEGNAVHNAWTFAQARRPERAEGMLRLYAVESALSLTGANADHRLAVPPRLLPSFLGALAAELGLAGGTADLPPLPPAAAARVPLLARDLRAAGVAGVVAVGRRQPAALHAQALAINRALGSVGGAVTLHPLDDVAAGPIAHLATLAAAMEGGAIDTLVILGGNPVYDAPSDLRFEAALAKVPHSVCLSLHRHETGRACRWHVPEAHAFESWSDARSADGTASVVQPLIAPLLGGVGRVEMLALLAEGAMRGGHELVRETWGAAASDDGLWRQVLHDGLAEAGSAPPGGLGPVRRGADGRRAIRRSRSHLVPARATAVDAEGSAGRRRSLRRRPGGRRGGTAAPAAAPAPTPAPTPRPAGAARTSCRRHPPRPRPPGRPCSSW